MAENNKAQIGKDVIESLTLGMYEDCRFIYREYVQNAADQVDKAVAEGLMNKGEEHIQIEIDPENRSIIIEDNATGIAETNVVPILRNIAHSTKQRGVDKGFRGIGRLGGLGYCAKLRFETSYKGEPVKSIMTWDAELLKFIINDRDNQEEAVEVLERVTDTKTYQEAADEHYFRVVMEDVSSDDLLDIKSVTDYLSMVAPVEINSRFIFRSKIREYMKENNLSLDTYNIYINDTQIYKPYTNYIYEDNHGGKKQVDDILDVDSLQHRAVFLFLHGPGCRRDDEAVVGLRNDRNVAVTELVEAFVIAVRVGDHHPIVFVLGHAGDRRIDGTVRQYDIDPLTHGIAVHVLVFDAECEIPGVAGDDLI